jgi:hypothetical protein
VVYQSISWMKWPGITTYAEGRPRVASVTTVLSRFHAEWAPQGPPEAIMSACEEAGYTARCDRVLTPVTTLNAFFNRLGV